MKMKAWTLYDIGDIRLGEAERPFPPAGQALVRVACAGICGSDIPRIYQTGAHRHPLIPGHEFSGVVEEAGEGLDPSWVGKRVGVFPLIPCRSCEPCGREHYEMCKNYNYLGSRCNGGFAEYVAVPEWNLVELPQGVGLDVAAMLEPMAVAAHAMGRVSLSTESTIAVIGLGTIGMFLLMFLKEAGYEKIYAVGNKDFQKRNALSLGIKEEDYCNGKEQDAVGWLMGRTGDQGADVIFECVGRNETCLQAVEAAAPFGQVVFLGNPFSDMPFPRDVYWKILRSQLTIRGTWNSSYTGSPKDDWHYVLNRIAAGKLKPERMISHRLPLERLEEGLLIMRDKKEDYGKIIVEP